jgi:ABC-type lipoprotein release transport system permease subunit
VSLLLLAAALVACIVPTWRALEVRPSEVLRYE